MRQREGEHMTTREWQLGFVGGFAIGLILGVVLGLSSGAQAQVGGLTITLPEQPPYPRGPAGSVHLQATVTDHGLPIGAMCDVDVATSNSDSIHPNTNVIVTSNGDQVTAFDVEDGEGAVHQTRGTLTIGDTITVAVQLGAHEVSSLGMEIIFTCNPPTTTTPPTTVPPPSSITTTTTSDGTTTTSSTSPATTTTETPEGGVPAGGGSEASVSDVATQLWLALLVIGVGALIGGWWKGKHRDG